MRIKSREAKRDSQGMIYEEQTEANVLEKHHSIGGEDDNGDDEDEDSSLNMEWQMLHHFPSPRAPCVQTKLRRKLEFVEKFASSRERWKFF